VLNADSKKESVNQAKYSIARKTGLSLKTLQELDRVGLREELSEANKWLNSKAKKAIETQKIKRQGPLEELHKQVGEQVRQSIVQSLRTYPENLPVEKDIEQVKKELNDIYKELS